MFVHCVHEAHKNFKILYEKECRKLSDSSCWTRVARVNAMINTKRELPDNEQKKSSRVNSV